MQISDKGIDFVVRHEGFVSKAYRDPVGIITIGTGFTNRSKVASRMLGNIKLGMTITREQNDRVLAEAFKDEYGPPVVAALPNAKQHEHDAGASYCFNCGPGAMKDLWVKAAAAGDIDIAAAKLRSSRTTAKGKKLPGLVKRRQQEARLLELGDYGVVWTSRSEKQIKPREPDEELKEYQELLEELGYDCGEADGWHGPKTEAAVMAFQKNQPNLKADGILGPATKAAIKRASQMRKEASTGAIINGGVVAGGTATAAVTGMDWHLVATILAVAGLTLLVGVMLYKWRDEIKHWVKG